jgi:hypothetical protein
VPRLGAAYVLPTVTCLVIGHAAGGPAARLRPVAGVLVLLNPAITDRATAVAATVGGVVAVLAAVLAAGLPAGTGLLLGAAAERRCSSVVPR